MIHGKQIPVMSTRYKMSESQRFVIIIGIYKTSFSFSRDIVSIELSFYSFITGFGYKKIEKWGHNWKKQVAVNYQDLFACSITYFRFCRLIVIVQNISVRIYWTRNFPESCWIPWKWFSLPSLGISTAKNGNHVSDLRMVTICSQYENAKHFHDNMPVWQRG